MVELSALGQNYFTPTHSAEFVLGFCFLHCGLPAAQRHRVSTGPGATGGRLEYVYLTAGFIFLKSPHISYQIRRDRVSIGIPTKIHEVQCKKWLN